MARIRSRRLRRWLIPLRRALRGGLGAYNFLNDKTEDLAKKCALLLRIGALFGSLSVFGEAEIAKWLGWEHSAPPPQEQVALNLDMLGDVGVRDFDCGVQTNGARGSLSPERIGSFINTPPYDRLEKGLLKDKVADLLLRLGNRGHPIRKLLLIGSADIQTAPPSWSNAAIANKRIAAVLEEINAQWRGETPPTTLLAIRGPDSVRARQAKWSLANDRSVEVCVFWG